MAVSSWSSVRIVAGFSQWAPCDQAGAVEVGEQRPAVSASAADEPVLPGLPLVGWAHPSGLDDRVGHLVEQLLLAAEVRVQRG
jgi:hypothetical protein